MDFTCKHVFVLSEYTSSFQITVNGKRVQLQYLPDYSDHANYPSFDP